jgi:CheY-like chemotaxis protein
VDDEEAVREYLSAMLTAAGYHCRKVAGGLEALALLNLERGVNFFLAIPEICMLLSCPCPWAFDLRRFRGIR